AGRSLHGVGRRARRQARVVLGRGVVAFVSLGAGPARTPPRRSRRRRPSATGSPWLSFLTRSPRDLQPWQFAYHAGNSVPGSPKAPSATLPAHHARLLVQVELGRALTRIGMGDLNRWHPGCLSTSTPPPAVALAPRAGLAAASADLGKTMPERSG